MKSYEVTETIQAGPDEVWAVLGDVEHYPDWDSGVEKVEGRLEPGGKLKVFSELDPGRGYPVKVTELSPGATRLEMREQFSGPLLPLIGRSLPDFQPSFDKFASGLKALVERRG